MLLAEFKLKEKVADITFAFVDKIPEIFIGGTYDAKNYDGVRT